MLRFVEVSMGAGGVVACSRCGRSEPAAYRPAEEIVAEAAAAASSWAGPGPANVALTGAEPFGHPDLPSIVSDVVDAGVARLRLETSGSALGHGDNAAGAQASGALHLRVRLLGGEATHDALADAPGLFIAARAGMAAWTAAASASDAATFLSGVMPVCEHNVAEAPAAVAAFAAAGAREVLLRLGPGLDPERAAPWLAAACDTGTVNRVWVRLEGASADLLPAHALHVTPLLPREVAP